MSNTHKWLRIGWMLLAAWAAGGGWAGAESADTTGRPPAVESGLDLQAKSPDRSRITNVTVFSDRALVTRRSEVSLGAGEHSVVFDRLPASLDSESVQIKGLGAGTIRGVNLEFVPAAGAEDEDLRQLIRRQRRLEEAQQGVRDSLAEAGKEKEFVEAIARRLTAASDKSEPGELNPQKWIDMVAFYRRRLAALDEELRNNNAKLPPLQEELRQVQEEIRNLQRDRQAGKYRAEVLVDMPAEGRVSLELAYVVQGPGWVPQYDLRADSRGARMQVSYQASIRQSTGEDWSQVELTLSTAQPRAGSRPPELEPWRVIADREPPQLSKRQGKPVRGAAAAPAMAMTMAVDEAQPVRPSMAVEQAAVENQASAVVFSVRGRHTVTGDNQAHRVTVAVLDFPVTFAYSAVPKRVAAAFLEARITNNSEYPLLSGGTTVFLDNAFVAHGDLKTVAPGEIFEAFLGADDGMQVEHKLVNRKEQKEGVFGGRVKWLYDYRLKVTNRKSQAFDVVLRDQIPLSGHGDIQIELLEPQVREGNGKLKKDDLNILEWSLRVDSGRSVEIPLKFTVSYPRDLPVSGL